MATHWDLMKDVIPNDHSRQVNSRYYIDSVMRASQPPNLVVDLGCGRGKSVDVFRSYSQDILWVGVDIADSPEVQQREKRDLHFVTYDGATLPFRRESIPLIYSHQVFEHVRDPRALLSEIYRVLTHGGKFIGSTSQLEPYHSFSVWNFTLYGFRTLVEEAGLTLLEVRPSIDAIALIMRAYNGRPEESNKYFREESPLNTEIDTWGESTRRRAALINNRKLQFCGQFAFKVGKDQTSSITK